MQLPYTSVGYGSDDVFLHPGSPPPPGSASPIPSDASSALSASLPLPPRHRASLIGRGNDTKPALLFLLLLLPGREEPDAASRGAAEGSKRSPPSPAAGAAGLREDQRLPCLPARQGSLSACPGSCPPSGRRASGGEEDAGRHPIARWSAACWRGAASSRGDVASGFATFLPPKKTNKKSAFGGLLIAQKGGAEPQIAPSLLFLFPASLSTPPPPASGCLLLLPEEM